MGDIPDIAMQSWHTAPYSYQAPDAPDMDRTENDIDDEEEFQS